ncbi:leucine--tRNA ligase [Mycoplasmopsis agassizii]|uniref:leucine--tRNA ligase n=1 Tax=Mycoplasmopsis agassizii TaxID=33922 RepID=A0A269TJV3_9BACT|nr:class I tRNA ligase family protein [Mycoplasmopsis agassizii]PAK21793.1 leucine--tRNA ligase [Mycoplasmopsis agassizii]
MNSDNYNFSKIEKKWQAYWEKAKPWKAVDNGNKKIYVLEMFYYPSGAGIHLGHPEGYTAGDIIARTKRLQGYDVLHPMGADSFGLPAEQYALNTGNHPSTFTDKNIDNIRRQLKALGFSYDWDREVKTSDPAYYRWTQFIFTELYKKGLAELRDTEVNWCEGLGTVLANEEIIVLENGERVSERGSFPVTNKIMKQWVLKITEYADRLLDQLDLLQWEDSIKRLQRNWIGREVDEDGNKTFKLRDWIFARQRYWGEPFPVLFDEDNNVHLVDELVELPYMENIKPSGTGEGPLANNKEWISFEKDGKRWRRDSSVMPQWAGSCWYYLAYILKNDDGTYEPINSEEAKKRFKKWLPVDVYIGGQEHAVLHLIYSRFWHFVLYDIGLVDTPEPYSRLINQGMILGPDGTKMSKSLGNVISPDEIVNEFGADTLRVTEMFMGPLSEDKSWSHETTKGVYKWLARVYRLFKNFLSDPSKISKDSYSQDLENKYNLFIKDVTSDIEQIKFNLAISKMMVFVNELYKLDKIYDRNILKDFAIILSTFAPHLGEELLELLGEKTVEFQVWPEYDENKILGQKIKYPVHINNKLKVVIEVDNNSTKDHVIQTALEQPEIKLAIANKKIKKEIFVEGKTVNFLV